MKKIITLLLIITISNIFGEEIKYKINKTTQAWTNYLSEKGYGEDFKLYPGDIVTYNNQILMNYVSSKFRIEIKTKYGDIGWVHDDELERTQESDLLPESITSRHWVISYYKDVLKSKDRVEIFKYEPYWINWVDTDMCEDLYEWWELYTISSLFIKNNLICLQTTLEAGGQQYFVVKKVVKNTIYAEAIFNNIGQTMFGFMNNLEEVKEYKLLFKEDGDYLKLYINSESEENLLEEFIAIDENFYNALKYVRDKNPGKDNPVPGFSKINWPKRASEK